MGVTKHPTGLWTTQMARNFADMMDGPASKFKFLIRDRGSKFVKAFDIVFNAVGVRVIKTPVRAPQVNAFPERFVGTIRRECFDWLLIFNERHALRVAQQFAEFYNTERPHRGLYLEIPDGHEVVPLTSGRKLRRNDRVDGLIHAYDTMAA